SGGVEPASRFLDGVGPEAHAFVAGIAGEAHALLDQRAADAEAAGGGLDIEHAQLRRAGNAFGRHDEDRADDSAIALSHPEVLGRALRGSVILVVDLGDERLELAVPAVLLAVDDALPVHHPADIAD